MARAMRPDKTTLAGVAATLALYRAGVATRTVPVWRAISMPAEVLRGRATVLAAELGDLAEAVDLASTVGGGALPGETLPSAGIALRARSADRLLGRLRAGRPPIVARIDAARVVLDLRTVDPSEDPILAAAVRQVMGSETAAPG